VQHFYVPPFTFVPDRELDSLTDSHFKLNSLDDTKELLNTSHHKITFEYDEDTAGLVIEPPSPQRKHFFPMTQMSLLGMHQLLLNIIAMKLRLTNLNLIIMGQKS
jgi:hypothetical protein